MKFLQAAVLSVIFVGYVTASDPDYVGDLGLRKAIDEGRLDIAVELVKQDEALGKDGVIYVITKDDPDLIANFVNQTNQANASTLEELWDESPKETFEKVWEKVDFPQQALVDLAASHKLASRPRKFLVLLNKIVKPEDQEKVVEKGIEQLANNVHCNFFSVKCLERQNISKRTFGILCNPKSIHGRSQEWHSKPLVRRYL